MSKKRATIIDVAAAANVSHMTVSRYFNAPEKLSAKMRDRVKTAVERNNYIQNLAAQSFFRRQSRCLALIVPNIVNSYMTKIVQGAEDACREAGYTLFLCNSNNDVTVERDYVNALVSRSVEGIALFTARVGEVSVETNRMIDEFQIPVVLVISAPDADEHDIITTDSYSGGHMLAMNLVRSGYKHVAIVGGTMEHPNIRDRVKGLLDAFQGSGVDAYFMPGSLLEAAGAEAVADLHGRDHLPQAFVATTNTVGLGVLKGLKKLGKSIDVASFDATDTGLGGLYEPFILVAQSDAHEVGYQAITMVLDRINAPDTPQRKRVLPMQLEDKRNR